PGCAGLKSCELQINSGILFFLADDIQFSTSLKIQKTPIKTPTGIHWLGIPILRSHRGKIKIREVRIDTTRHWRKKHYRSIKVNYCYAPYFEWFVEIFNPIFSSNWTFLVDVNLKTIELVQKAIGLEKELRLTSDFSYPSGATESIVSLTQQVGGTHYIAGEPERSFLKPDLFEQGGISLDFLSPTIQPYPQLFGNFVADLSIIDLLCNVGPYTLRWLSAHCFS
ncbi:MAG: hypothetical protein D6732_26505, partial [Methanobacteriota archaeon]